MIINQKSRLSDLCISKIRKSLWNKRKTQGTRTEFKYSTLMRNNTKHWSVAVKIGERKLNQTPKRKQNNEPQVGVEISKQEQAHWTWPSSKISLNLSRIRPWTGTCLNYSTIWKEMSFLRGPPKMTKGFIFEMEVLMLSSKTPTGSAENCSSLL